jgi:hypothetical protein
VKIRCVIFLNVTNISLYNLLIHWFTLFPL